MIYSRSPYTMSEFLQKDNYILEKVFCDVYSISSAKLVELAAYVCAADNQRTDELDMVDICFAIEDIVNNNQVNVNEKLTIHSHYKPYPGNNHIIRDNATKIWNKCGKTVNLNGHSFHPKLLLACFAKEDEQGKKYYYRLQVGTGNLTGSKSLDMAVIVEGEAIKNNDPNPCNGQVLYSFYEKIFNSLGERAVPGILCDLKNTQFESKCNEFISENTLCAKISDINFAFTFPDCEDIKNKLPDELKDKNDINDINIYSPFINFDSENGTTYLDDKFGDKTLHYYTNLTLDICDKWEKIKNPVSYCKKAGSFLHAKVYTWKIGENECRIGANTEKIPEYRVWLGSANASKNGWENNAEFDIGFNLKFLKCDAEKDYIIQNKWKYKTSKDSDPEKTAIFDNDKPKPEDAFTSEDETYWQRILVDCISIKADNEDDNKVKLKFDIKKPNCEKKAYKKIVLRFFYGYNDTNVKEISIDKQSNKIISKSLSIDKVDLPLDYSMMVKASIETEKTTNLSLMVDIKGELPEDDRNPESMLLLLNPIRAIDAIPRCAEAGFSNPKDNIYERLSAYICSYNSKDNEQYEKITQRIDKIKEKVGTLYYISDTETEKLDFLEKLCKGE